MSNQIIRTRELFTENEYGVTIKYDDREKYNCYVVLDENCVGFGNTPEEALSQWVDEFLEFGELQKHPRFVS